MRHAIIVVVLCVALGCDRDWRPADEWDRACHTDPNGQICQEICQTEPDRWWCNPPIAAQAESCARDASQPACIEAATQALDAGVYAVD